MMRNFYIFGISLFLFTASARARDDQNIAAQGDARLSGGGTHQRLTPAQVMGGIYKPWTGPLAELEKNLRENANYVVWIHVPAQHPMDLRSAENFRRWFNATPLTQLTISHNMVAWRCRNEKGQMVTGATGITGSSNRQDAKAILAGYGLSVFFSTFTDGHLNPQQEVGDYVMKNLRKRGAIFAGFEVTNEQCDSMQGFLADFVHHPSRPFEKFSAVQDPEKLEGGGCVTFASALLNKAGQLDTVIPRFYRDIPAARHLLGGNIRAVKDVVPPVLSWLKGQAHSVSIFKFINANWTVPPKNASIPGTASLKQMDPEKMGYALQQFSKVYLEGLSGAERERVARKLAASPLGVRVVKTRGRDYNKPSSPVEWGKFPINDSFDPEMAQVGREARAWLRNRLSNGYHVRLGEAVGMPVLLVELP